MVWEMDSTSLSQTCGASVLDNNVGQLSRTAPRPV